VIRGIEYTIKLMTGENIEVIELNEPYSTMKGSDYLAERGFVTIVSSDFARDLRLGHDSKFRKLAKGEPTRCLMKVEPQRCANYKSCPVLNKTKCVPSKLHVPFCWESSHEDEDIAGFFTFCVSAWSQGQWVVLVRDDNRSASQVVR